MVAVPITTLLNNGGCPHYHVPITTNWKQAREAGLKVGAYHYFSLSYGGEVQARNFIETVSSNDVQLPPVIDLEYVGNSKQRPSKEKFQKELKIYLNLIKEKYNKEPVLYTTSDFYKDYLYPEISDQPLWIRSLTFKPKIEWVFWQYSQWGEIEGIGGYVDLNFFNGTTLDLEKFFSS